MSETVTEAVAAFGEAVAAWAPDDPRRTSLALARMMAARLDEGSGDWRMAESLVGLMRSLAVDPEYPPDAIDTLRAQGAARHIEQLARQARGEELPVRPAQHWIDGEQVSHG